MDFSVILSKFDGLFISNGPGNPEHCSVLIDRLVLTINILCCISFCLSHLRNSSNASLRNKLIYKHFQIRKTLSFNHFKVECISHPSPSDSLRSYLTTQCSPHSNLYLTPPSDSLRSYLTTQCSPHSNLYLTPPPLRLTEILSHDTVLPTF